MDLTNVVLPGDKDKVIYNCYEQQVMQLAYYYTHEYWKLFLGNKMEYEDKNFIFLEDVIKTSTSIDEMAYRYYGLEWEEVPSDGRLSFENQETYFISMNVKDYPFSSDIEAEGRHCFLIYGQTEDGYLVNDKYYNLTDFVLKEELYKKGEKSVFLINRDKNFVPPMSVENEIIERLSHSYCDTWEKAVDLIERQNVKEYHSANLLDMVQSCYSYLKKDAEILSENYLDEPYMKVCMDILDEIANAVKKQWYRLIKTQLQYEMIPFEVICARLRELIQVLKVERTVKKEAVNLLTHGEGLKEKLERQLLEYLQLDKVDDNRSVFEDHEVPADMYLILYWEEKNQIQDLEYLAYKNLNTYGEYKLITFQNILRTGLEKR